jgi:hypothetical protein
MKRISTTSFVPACLFLGLGLALFAQSVSQISGTVKDATGLGIPGAQVTVTQTDTGVTRTAESDTNGVYALPSLPIGPYRMEVKKEGFTTVVENGIVLQVDTAPTIDPVMKVGGVNESVQVEASAAMVETHSTGVGQVVNSQDVVELPLNGREITQLITLAGGSNIVQYGFGQAPSSGNLISSKNYPNEALVSVAGGMLNGTTYLLDGGTHNDPFNNLNLPLPFPDAVQEFKVETSALPAEYGQHSAGAVNVVSKSGSNEFHGDAFEFVRNGDFNARDFFAPTNDNLKRNQFGGTLGGPIKKNKLFFFVGYQNIDPRYARRHTCRCADRVRTDWQLPGLRIAMLPNAPDLESAVCEQHSSRLPRQPSSARLCQELSNQHQRLRQHDLYRNRQSRRAHGAGEGRLPDQQQAIRLCALLWHSQFAALQFYRDRAVGSERGYR